MRDNDGGEPGIPALETGRLAGPPSDTEIACDESGSEGEKLIGGETDVFAHAGVRLNAGSAADCVREIRARIGSPALEYKSNHLLRQKNRPVLAWLLGPSGPILGKAHVHLTDKAFFVVGKVVDVLVPPEKRTDRMAVTLYLDGKIAFERGQWEAFLGSFNNLMRAKTRRDVPSVDSFFHLVDELRLTGTPGRAHEILGLLGQARPDLASFRAKVLDDPTLVPVLDPLIPAIVQAVVYWSGGRTPVSLVHDEQLSLTEERIAQLKVLTPDGWLASLRLVDSRSDARVQIADFLAGVARKIASEELNGRGDAQLTALLRPYVDSSSIWGDARSWSLLGPPDTRS